MNYSDDERETFGREVRAEWVAWAREQPNPKPSWLKPWEELTEPEREVDRRIGTRLHALGVLDEARAAGTCELGEPDSRRSWP